MNTVFAELLRFLNINIPNLDSNLYIERNILTISTQRERTTGLHFERLVY